MNSNCILFPGWNIDLGHKSSTKTSSKSLCSVLIHSNYWDDADGSFFVLPDNSRISAVFWNDYSICFVGKIDQNPKSLELIKKIIIEGRIVKGYCVYNPIISKLMKIGSPVSTPENCMYDGQHLKKLLLSAQSNSKHTLHQRLTWSKYRCANPEVRSWIYTFLRLTFFLYSYYSYHLSFWANSCSLPTLLLLENWLTRIF